jgi:hypothetical protein
MLLLMRFSGTQRDPIGQSASASSLFLEPCPETDTEIRWRYLCGLTSKCVFESVTLVT